jgi:preprotein translocase subunit SecG
MSIIITVFHLIACFVLIIVVLLQTGKGADIGAVFGGSSQTIFGSSGAGNLLTRITTWCAVLFMLTSLYLTWSSTRHLTASIADTLPAEPPPIAAPIEPKGAPAAPADEGAPAAKPAEEGAPAGDAGAKSDSAPAPAAAAAPAEAPAPAAAVEKKADGATASAPADVSQPNGAAPGAATAPADKAQGKTAEAAKPKAGEKQSKPAAKAHKSEGAAANP